MRQDKGVNGDAQRLEQMGWMLFLKIFDAKDEELEDMDETGEFVTPIPKEYQWRNWAANDEGITGDELITFIDRKLFHDLSNLKVQDNKRAVLVRDVFRGNNNYMKSGQLFRQVVNELNKIDFHASKDRHVFGQVYETILKELQSAGSSGEFYTPRAVTEFMTQIIDPKLGERILDPACGTGGFLTAAIEHIRKSGVENLEQRQQLQNSVHGFELKPLPHMLAVTNLILHDIEVPDIAYEDSLLRNQSIKPKNRVDVILANPPFGGNVDEATASTFPVGYRTKESADLFLIMMVNFLKQGGRAAIVLPDASLSGDGTKARIREMLIRTCNLHTIVRLPNSVFKPYASVATNLLFFERISSPSEEQEDLATKEIWYFEHKLPEGSKAYSMTNPILLEEFEVEKAWWNNRTESENAWKINLSEIIKNAIEDAKPHYEKEKELKREAYSLKEKVSAEKTALKDIEKNQTAKIEKQQEKITQFESSLLEIETKARIEKQTADSIYYSAFDLDIKNPIQIEENFGDPNKLVSKQESIIHEINNDIEKLKMQIIPSLKEDNFEMLKSYFNRFVYSKSNIDYLRQTILQLAMQGKLTTEWRNKNKNINEAPSLIEIINNEKENLIKAGKLKRTKHLSNISESEKSFIIPESWTWERIGTISQHNSGKTLDSIKNKGLEKEYITTSNLYWGYFKLDNLKTMLINESELNRCTAEMGDLLICEGGEAGRAAVWEYNFNICFQNHIHRVRPFGNINSYYIFRYFQKLNHTGEINSFRKGMGISNMSSTSLASIPIPIPPIEEQIIIVEKLNHLMSICDELEKKIEKRDSYQERIMQAVVKQVFTTL